MNSWRILINDGLETSGQNALIKAGFSISTNKISQEDLSDRLKDFDGVIIRSATQIKKEQLENNPHLKFVARAGVGLDNVDVDFAKSNNIHVINTPGASSRSVAELAMSHLLCVTRSLQLTNREQKDDTSFKALKKSLSSSTEIKNKTLVLLGFGRIGSELARMAIGLEMNVVVVDPYIQEANTKIRFNHQELDCALQILSLEQALPMADYISLHAPYMGKPILDNEQFQSIKPGCILVNTSRGENINEDALVEAIDSGIIGGAGLDVFQNEPKVSERLYNHPKISVTPHIAASTQEAQSRIAEELVEKIISLKNNSKI
jgi:D-3-phosphoglycerate dehydrogenase / 2-oxoglutarate reductase